MFPTTENQLRNTVASLPAAQANRLRDIFMNPAQKKERAELVETFGMIKTAATVAAIVSMALFLILPNLLTGALMGLVLYGAFEICTVSSNVKEIFDNFAVEAQSGRSEATLLDQLSKGACLARYVIPLLW